VTIASRPPKYDQEIRLKDRRIAQDEIHWRVEQHPGGVLLQVAAQEQYQVPAHGLMPGRG
jgi:hypothetical protein